MYGVENATAAARPGVATMPPRADVASPLRERGREVGD